MSESKPLTIVELTASNVKRLRAVHIKPDGAAVVLGGKNGAGKSSVLDAIEMALAGERSIPRAPVRKGEERGEIVADLGEIIVKRTFTAGGGTALTVTNREGARFPSPQAMLDKLTGSLTFDPLAFSRMKAEQQSETLRRMVGLDFAALDAERAQVFAQRTDVNRDGKAMAARFATMPQHLDVPEAEVSMADILAERDAAVRRNAEAVDRVQSSNRANDVKRRQAADIAQGHLRAVEAVRAAGEQVETWQEMVTRTEEEIARLTNLLAAQRRTVEAHLATRHEKVAAAKVLEERAATARAEVAALIDERPPALDLAPFAARIAAVEATNAKVRANAARAAAEEALNAKRAESLRLTARIDAIDQEKAAAIAAAAMPVEGLGFDADGVTLDGLPFEQASQAQQLRVSVAMGFAMNPRLRVLLIRDASLLDTESLAMVTKMAEDAGAQVWMERVEQDGATTVLIEDGNATAVEKVGAA